MAVLAVCAAVMLGGVFYTSCVSSQYGSHASASANKVAVEVGGLPIYAEALSEQVSQQKANQMPMGGGLSPDMELNLFGSVVSNAVNSASQAAVAQANGKISDEDLLKALDRYLEGETEAYKSQLVAMDKLKADATQEQFDKAYKDLTGNSLADYKKKSRDGIAANLKDPEKRNAILLGLSGTILQIQAESKVNLTDADVKRQFDMYEVKRILAKNIVPGNASVDERIAKAEAALKSGTPFEKAVDLYSEDLPMGGKKLSDMTNTIPGAGLLSDPEMKSLLSLKAGDVSGIVKTPEGKAIYKVINVKSDVPKDYDRRKDFYKQQLVAEITQPVVKDQVEAFKAKPGAVKFVSKGWKAVYDYQEAMTNVIDPSGKGGPADKMPAIYDEAKAAVKEGGSDARPAVLVQYAAVSFMLRNPGADKEKLRPELIESVKAILDRSENFQVRMSLVDAYIEGKQTDEAVAALIAAVESNRVDAAGEANNVQIADRLAKMIKDKQLKPEQEKAIQDAQVKWRAEFDEAKRQAEEVKKAREKEEAAAKAEAEAAAKKAAAEAAKQKGPVTPTPSTTTPSTTGGTAPSGTPAPTTATTGGAPTPGTPTPAPTQPKKP